MTTWAKQIKMSEDIGAVNERLAVLEYVKSRANRVSTMGPDVREELASLVIWMDARNSLQRQMMEGKDE